MLIRVERPPQVLGWDYHQSTHYVQFFFSKISKPGSHDIAFKLLLYYILVCVV
jgi:hypothetical protein